MNNMASYVFYFAMFFSSLVWVNQYEKLSIINVIDKIKYWMLITFPIVFMQGFRYDVGTDYMSYVRLVRGFANDNSLFISWYSNEPLFMLIAKLSYWLLEQEFMFFLIEAILMNLVFFVVADKYREEVSMVRLYIVYYLICVPYFLNAERQGLAVVIVWLSTKYAKEKKFLKFLMCIVMATLIHNTAIVGIAIYLLNILRGDNKKFLRYFCVVFSLGVPMILGRAFPVLASKIGVLGKYAKFINEENVEQVPNVNFIFWLVIVVILICFLYKSNIDVLLRTTIIILSCLQLSAYLLNNYINYGFRISFYYQISTMYAYAYTVPKIKPKSMKLLFEFMFIGLYIFYFTYKFLIQGNSAIFPFQFIWDVL